MSKVATFSLMTETSNFCFLECLPKNLATFPSWCAVVQTTLCKIYSYTPRQNFIVTVSITFCLENGLGNKSRLVEDRAITVGAVDMVLRQGIVHP